MSPTNSLVPLLIIIILLRYKNGELVQSLHAAADENVDLGAPQDAIRLSGGCVSKYSITSFPRIAYRLYAHDIVVVLIFLRSFASFDFWHRNQRRGYTPIDSNNYRDKRNIRMAADRTGQVETCTETSLLAQKLNKSLCFSDI